MTKFDEISRWLSASGAILSLDGDTTSLILEGDNTLYSKTWRGSEFSGPVWIAAGVKAGTSAACVSDLAVFAIDENNTIRCYVKTEDESIDEDETWPEKSLAGGNITVHPDRQLAIHAAPARTTVFYQDLGQAYEYREGPIARLDNVDPAFFKELVKYLQANDLTGLLGLEVLAEEVPEVMCEFVLGDNGTVMLDSRDLKSWTPFRTTGFVHKLGMVELQGPSHAKTVRHTHQVLHSRKIRKEDPLMDVLGNEDIIY